MKTLSQYLAKITLLVILATFLYLPGSIKITRAASDSDVCNFVNAQNGSVGKADTMILTPPPDTGVVEDPAIKTKRIADNNAILKKAMETQAAYKKQAAAGYPNKLVVITEEPLGVPAAGFSTTCSRVSTCSTGLFDGNNPNPIRKCFTTYLASCPAADAPADPNAKPAPDAPTTTCETVQVYFSDGGTTLLYGYIGAIYRYFAILGGFIAVLVLIVAGIMRSASGDNAEMLGKANQLVVRVISGLVVLFLSAVILYTINPNFFVL